MNELIMQTVAYAVVMLVVFLFFTVLQKGFFFNFLKVKTSFGRLILIKVATVHNSYFKVGKIEEGFLKFKDKREDKKFTNRIKIPTDKKVLYRTLGVWMIDINEEKNAICTVDYEAVTGYDPVKIDELIQRAIHAPTLDDTKAKIMFILMIGTALGIAICVYFLYTQSEEILLLKTMVQTLVDQAQTVPAPAPI